MARAVEKLQGEGDKEVVLVGVLSHTVLGQHGYSGLEFREELSEKVPRERGPACERGRPRRCGSRGPTEAAEPKAGTP